MSAQFWLHRPPAEHGHNIAFSFGTVFPTGSDDVRDTVQTVNGPQRVFVDQSIQLGAGGYGISLGTQAYQRVKRAVLYSSGTYLITPQEQNGIPNASLAGVKFKPNPLTSTMSIPDQYLADGGIAYAVPKIRGMAAKFGMRYEGVKVRDLIGGSLGFRRPGYALSVEPGMQYERGKSTWSLNIPVAVQRNRKRSVPDLIQGKAGDAAFADYLICWDMRIRSRHGSLRRVLMRIGRTLAVAFLFLLGMRGFAGEGAARLSLHDTQGNTQDISMYRGRIVVLNFWATWCVPCQHEMPLLAEMQKKYENKGVVVLGASVDDKKSQPLIQPFAEKNKIPFPLLVAATTDQMQQLQLGEAIPATAFFDADGNLVARVLGELDKSDLEKRLEWMLGKRHGKTPPSFVNGFQKKRGPDITLSVFAR